MPRVLVVGSVNVDLHLRVPRLPAAGETVLSGSFDRVPGGKGGNQACAVAALGVPVELLAAVGDDADGVFSLDALRAAGVGVDRVVTVASPTGLAIVMVDAAGENAIAVVSGANAALGPEHLDRASFVGVDAVVLLLEVPLPTVVAALGLAREVGARVVLNAAPAMALDESLLERVDVLVVNEGEAKLLGAGAPLAAREAVVITRGALGCTVRDARGSRDVAAYAVDAVDSTGAGDCFVGALTAALVSGRDIDAAARYASAAAALSVQRSGARSAPDAHGVLSLLGE